MPHPSHSSWYINVYFIVQCGYQTIFIHIYIYIYIYLFIYTFIFIYLFNVKDVSCDGKKINFFSKESLKPRFTYRLSNGQWRSEFTSEINV
jgi:hypothetical protein